MHKSGVTAETAFLRRDCDDASYITVSHPSFFISAAAYQKYSGSGVVIAPLTPFTEEPPFSPSSSVLVPDMARIVVTTPTRRPDERRSSRRMNATDVFPAVPVTAIFVIPSAGRP